MTELVSIVIPTYNRAHVVSRAVRSALSQTHSFLEVIVVDDGSQDDTPGVIAAIQRQDSRVRYLGMPGRGGAQAARVEGMRRSMGEYIAFLDSDVELTPRSVETRLKVFQKCSKETGLVYGDLSIQSAGGTRTFRFRVLHGYSYGYLCREMCLCNYSVTMIRRSCLFRTGFPDALFPAWQDDDMVMTIGRFYAVEHCGSVVAVDGASGCDRISANKWAVAVGCRMMVRKYRHDIVRHHGYFRLSLWHLRIANAYLDAVCQSFSRRLGLCQPAHLEEQLGRLALSLGCRALATISALLRRYLRVHFDRIYA